MRCSIPTVENNVLLETYSSLFVSLFFLCLNESSGLQTCTRQYQHLPAPQSFLASSYTTLTFFYQLTIVVPDLPTLGQSFGSHGFFFLSSLHDLLLQKLHCMTR